MSSGWFRSTSRLEEARASGTMATRSGRHRERTTMAAVEDDLTSGNWGGGLRRFDYQIEGKKIDWLTTLDRWRADPPQVIFNPFQTSLKARTEQ